MEQYGGHDPHNFSDTDAKSLQHREFIATQGQHYHLSNRPSAFNAVIQHEQQIISQPAGRNSEPAVGMRRSRSGTLSVGSKHSDNVKCDDDRVSVASVCSDKQVVHD